MVRKLFTLHAHFVMRVPILLFERPCAVGAVSVEPQHEIVEIVCLKAFGAGLEPAAHVFQRGTERLIRVQVVRELRAAIPDVLRGILIHAQHRDFSIFRFHSLDCAIAVGDRHRWIREAELPPDRRVARRKHHRCAFRSSSSIRP